MKRISAIGVKEDGKAFRVVNGKLLTEDLNGLPKGRYRLTVEKLHKQKSNPQLAYLYGCVYVFVLKALNDAGWEFTSIDEVDEYCKSMFSSKEIVNRHTGEIMSVPGLKRDMTTVELSTYTNAIRDWCAEYLGVFIPEPETQTVMQL